MVQALTRRGLIASAPAAVVAASLPAFAAAEGDEHLFELVRQLVRLTAIAFEADRRLTAAEDAHERATPPAPESMYVRDDDDLRLDFGPDPLTGRQRYLEGSLNKARDWLDVAGFTDPATDRRLSRLREVIADYDAWREIRRVAWDASGMSEAMEVLPIAYEPYYELIQQIARHPAKTFAGILLKVRIAMNDLGRETSKAEERIDEMLDDVSGAEALALSVVRDMARINEIGCMGGAHA